jgi:hypothetical protein
MIFLLPGVIVLVIGVVFFINSLRRFNLSIYGKENSIGFRLRTSMGFGASFSMLVLSMLLFTGVFDSGYKWTIQNFLFSLGMSAFLGIIVTVLSFLRSIIIGGFREFIFKRLRIKNKDKFSPKDHNSK